MMIRHTLFSVLCLAVALLSAPRPPARAAEARPPIAHVVPKFLEAHGVRRVDPYDWLRERDDPQVIAHLQAENAYADARLAAIKPLVEEIAGELRARSAQEDASVPYGENGYVYERRFARGAQYPVIVRRKEGAAEEVVLDVAALAAGHNHYRLDQWTVSPDGRRVAFAVDFTGARLHRVFVRTIATGEVVDQGIDNAANGLAFAADSETLFYVRVEPKTFRAFQVWGHRVDADPDTAELIYEEHDETFALSVSLTKSRKFVLIDSHQDQTSEIRYLPADRPEGAFRVMEARRPGVRYGVNHVGDRFFIRTDLDAPDFRVMTAPEDAPNGAHWRELIPERPGRFLWRVEPFEDFVAVDEEREGDMAIRVVRLSDLHEIEVPRPTERGVATTNFFFGGFGGNREPSSRVLRFRFSGPLRPEAIYDFDMAGGALTLRHEDPAAKWVQPELYGLDRIEATAPDGERVPVTVIYRKDLRRAGGNPTLVFGYGAYGFSSRAMFAPQIFSLLDRGFIYALAHVRGGHEKGERWHVQGRVLNKRNTFADFVATTEALVSRGYADRGALFAQGRSAGGMMVGALANERPDLYAGIVAEVPFVDVVTTMSDASIPLTTLEYDEWGNPALKEHHDYMLSYSPYDNVKAQRYPALFVTAGFHDSQVSYAEPAKWVARLRAAKTDDRELLFKVDMGAGHGGGTGRLGTVREEAEIMAWLVAQAGR